MKSDYVPLNPESRPLTWLLAAIIALAFSPAILAQTTKPVIAVWHQPASSIPTWKARGINTMLGAETDATTNVDAYCKAVKDAGLSIILGNNAQAHWADANCIAIMAEPDEPNGAGQRSPGQMLDLIVTIREKAPGKPVLINLDAWQMLYQSDAKVAAYCAAADWIAADQYPCNRGEAQPLTTIPVFLARLKRLAPGKHLFCCIETADQHTGAQDWAGQPDASGTPPRPRMHMPAALEIDAECRQTDAYGADYIYFPDYNDPATGAWAGYDGTQPMQADAITKINARKIAGKPP